MRKLVFLVSCLLFTASVSATSFPAEQAEVEAFLAGHTVARVTNYCLTDVLNCRSVVQYKDSSTGAMVESFEDRFMSSTEGRAVSFRGFFLKQSNGTFNIYAQNVMSNEVNIDLIEPYNQGVTLTFNSDNLPTLPLKFVTLGTDPLEFTLDNLFYSATEARFDNNTPNDPSDDFIIPFHSQTNH